MPRSTIVLVFLMSLTATCYAQDYFTLITAENRQPFYVRLDSQFYSSTPEGHLILSSLKDSTYKLTIGIPGLTAPEQHYTLSIRGKDREIQLRQQGDQGLRLYDEQTREWLPQEGGVAVQGSLGIKKDDAFSRMMAGVVKDTAVLYNTYAMEQALADTPAVTQNPAPAVDTTFTKRPALDTTRTARETAIGNRFTADTTLARRPKPDTALASQHTPDTPTIASRRAPDTARHTPDATVSASWPATDSISRISERRTRKSLRQVYADRIAGQKTDTVDVLIPVDTPAIAKVVPPVSTSAVDSTHNPSARKHGTDSPTVSQATTSIPPAPVTQNVDNTRRGDTMSKPPARVIPYINSDCHDFATDFDVDKLREKLLSATSDAARVVLSTKTFKTKCFSTKQLRQLSKVFDTDPVRFHFLEAAWPFAADEHFHELIDLLTDPVYISKFKTMTHQP